MSLIDCTVLAIGLFLFFGGLSGMVEFWFTPMISRNGFAHSAIVFLLTVMMLGGGLYLVSWFITEVTN